MTDEMRKHLEECHGAKPLGPHPFRLYDYVTANYRNDPVWKTSMVWHGELGKRIALLVCDTRTTDRHEWQDFHGDWHNCEDYVTCYSFMKERVTL